MVEMGSDLHEPYAQRLKALRHGLISGGNVLRLDDVDILVGEVSTFHGDTFMCIPFCFLPGQGFVKHDQTTQVQLTIDGLAKRSFMLTSGIHVVCFGRIYQTGEATFVGDRNCVVCHRPEWDPSASWDHLSLFSGAFDGWGQAFRCLPTLSKDVLIARQLCIDSNEDVMHTWGRKHRASVFRSPILPQEVWTAALMTGVIADVSDRTSLNMLMSQANLICTCSPPCPVWSKGGKSQGLASDQGWAFIDSLITATCAQPVLLLFECADEIMVHKHFPILENLLRLLGFRKIWDQTLNLATMASCQRNRWIAVWARSDLSSRPFDSTIRFSVGPIVGWSDHAYRFELPQSIQEQLHLTPSELAVYGDVRFLPRSKQGGLSNMSQPEVLRARIADPSKPLPTLCASYGAQHCLDERHLALKGIFAVLQCSHGQYAFIDPFVFSCLFGAIEEVWLPRKTTLAWHFVGNAISIPHALAAFVIGIQSIASFDGHVLEAVQKAWSRRLSSFKAAVVIEGEFAVLMPIESIIGNCARSFGLPSIDTSTLQIHIVFDEVFSFSGPVPIKWSMHKLLEQCFRLPESVFLQLRFTSAGEDRYHLRYTLEHFALIAIEWTAFVGSHQMCTFRFEWTKDDPVVEISPTLPFESPASCRAVCGTHGFEDVIMWPVFRFAFSASEHALRANAVTHQGLIVWTSPPVAISVVVVPDQLDFFVRQLSLAFPEAGDWSVIHCECGITRFALLPRVPRGSLPCVLCLWPHSGRSLPVEVDGDCSAQIMNVHGICSDIVSIKSNGLRVPSATIEHGAVVCLGDLPHIRAGGHHSNATILLPAGASFEDRCEFSINTFGWLSSDELIFHTTQIAWINQQYARFTQVLFWDVNLPDIEHDFGDLSILPDCLTIVPILVGSHWAAFEVLRRGHNTSVSIVGFPQPMLLRALQIIARILDINVQRIEHVHIRMPDFPHMCGWILLRRWLLASGANDTLAARDDGFRRLSIYHKNMIEEVLAASMEEWISHDAPVDLRSLALRLRRHFFVSLASTPPHVPATNVPLRVHFVGPTDAATVHARPSLGAHPEVPGFAIVSRLQDLSRNEGWLASDELNFLLDPLRLLFNQILFIPPGRWYEDRNDLVLFQDRQVDFRFHEHSIWFVIVEEAWIKFDLIAQGDRFALFVHCHQEFVELLPRFVVYIANALEVHASFVHAIHVLQVSPHGLCGWALVYDLFWRAGILLPDASFACRNALLNTRHHDLIVRIQQESHDEWRRLAEPALSNFCIPARAAFLGRVLQGFFDSHRGAAGGPTDAGTKKAGADASTPAPMLVDPLVANDPWKQPKKLFGSRWEDYTVAE